MEGISFRGMQVDSSTFEALGRMPQLRILILDGVKPDKMLSGVRLPSLAMLSWRGIFIWNGFGPSLPCALEAVESLAVLDISKNSAEQLPADLQARPS